VNRRTLKHSLSIAKISYLEWISNPKIILLLVSLALIYNLVITTYFEKISLMNNMPINLFEPYISTLNSGVVILIVPITYLILMCDCPKTGSIFFIVRTNKKAWLFGQIIFFALTSVTYLITMALITIIPFANNGFIANGWSLVTTKFLENYPEYSTSTYAYILPENIYKQMSVYEGIIGSTLLLFMYLMIIALIIILFNIYGQKTLGILTNISIIGLGQATILINLPIRWCFPMANTLLYLHYDKILATNIFPKKYSYLYFLVLMLFLLMVNLLSIKSVNIIQREED
jgi:hypothetical protein